MSAGQELSVRQRRQQICEMLRNKGIVCQDYLYSGQCPRGTTCPYMHIHNGETRQTPRFVCNFFAKGVCLRERCMYFHGTPEHLAELHAKGANIYRPQDFMKVALPPAEYLDSEGQISADHDKTSQLPVPVHASSTEQYSLVPRNIYDSPVVVVYLNTPSQMVPSAAPPATFPGYEPLRYNCVPQTNGIAPLTYGVSSTPQRATSSTNLTSQPNMCFNVGQPLQMHPMPNLCCTSYNPVVFQLP